MAEAKKMIGVYKEFAEKWMGLPVIGGHKSDSERFAGADDTLTIEALMQDGKALQSGTSHFLGQNFAKAFDVQFTNKEGKLDYVWATSWGVSTRLMGALIMAHSDNNGLVLPPKLAPIQVVMIPIYKGSEELAQILARLDEIAAELKKRGISVKIDARDNVRTGFKFAEYELKGVRGSTRTTSSNGCSTTKAALSWPIGTARPKRKSASRTRRKRRSGAFRSTPPPKRESASSAESLRTAASFLPGVIDVSLF